MPPFSIISAFNAVDLGFLGNNAAVVLLDKQLSAQEMQRIAGDLNQPATTFLWMEKGKHFVRWFAPDAEIELCGHGSLATFAYLNSINEMFLNFPDGTLSGWKNTDGTYSMKIESIISHPAGGPDKFITEGISAQILEYYSNDNKNIVVLENEFDVINAKPDFAILKNMEPFGIILTAPGNECDFVSRTLVPKVQQREDHATGSSHAALTPFWSQRLNKKELTAYQLSSRGGKFKCVNEKGFSILTGSCRMVASGHLSD